MSTILCFVNKICIQQHLFRDVYIKKAFEIVDRMCTSHRSIFWITCLRTFLGNILWLFTFRNHGFARNQFWDTIILFFDTCDVSDSLSFIYGLLFIEVLFVAFDSSSQVSWYCIIVTTLHAIREISRSSPYNFRISTSLSQQNYSQISEKLCEKNVSRGLQMLTVHIFVSCT